MVQLSILVWELELMELYKQRVLLRNKLSEAKMTVFDEISMVSSVLFFRLNYILTEIFGFDSEKAFSGLPLIVCGDFYQLSLVNSASIYSAN